jgi:hypothetical protein
VVHVPWLQTCPEAQALPHLPQLRRSDCRLTQDPEQSVWPLGQDPSVLHLPEAQGWPEGQTLPQEPQLLASLLVLVQVPEHRTCPGGHSSE